MKTKWIGKKNEFNAFQSGVNQKNERVARWKKIKQKPRDRIGGFEMKYLEKLNSNNFTHGESNKKIF